MSLLFLSTHSTVSDPRSSLWLSISLCVGDFFQCCFVAVWKSVPVVPRSILVLLEFRQSPASCHQFFVKFRSSLNHRRSWYLENIDKFRFSRGYLHSPWPHLYPSISRVLPTPTHFARSLSVQEWIHTHT